MRRIAHKIEHDAVELFGIGVDFDRGIDLVRECERLFCGFAGAIGFDGFVDDGRQRHDAPDGRMFVGAAVAQRVRRQRHRAIERSDKARRQALHDGIVDFRKPVRCQLCAREDVSEIVLDLGDGRAKRRKPRLLLQEAIELALHGGQFAFGASDFIFAAGGARNARRVFGIFAEIDHRPHQPRHGPRHHPVEAHIDEHARWPRR